MLDFKLASFLLQELKLSGKEIEFNVHLTLQSESLGFSYHLGPEKSLFMFSLFGSEVSKSFF